MKTLFLIVVAFVFPIITYAEILNDSIQPNKDEKVLICDQLSDSQCFGRPVNSICIVDAQKGQAGFCHQRSTPYDQEYVECWCY
jgi:hypothetical protein